MPDGMPQGAENLIVMRRQPSAGAGAVTVVCRANSATLSPLSNTGAVMSYSCPLCHAPLQPRRQPLFLPAAAPVRSGERGYVNLLPVQFKRSRDPGDSAEMMQARRAFLDAGHYQPLREAIAERLRHYAPADLLDIGCGEGYYTLRVCHHRQP